MIASHDLSKRDLFYRQLESLPAAERKRILSGLPKGELRRLETSWEWLARPKQLPPKGEWSTWLLLAGRGFGKTRCAAEWLADQAIKQPGNYAIFGRTAKETREVLIRGESGFLNALKARGMVPGRLKNNADFEVDFRDLIIRLANGAIIFGYSGETPDAVRGGNVSGIWFDELAFYAYARDVYDQASLTCRKGASRVVITTTPKAGAATELLREIMEQPGTVVTSGSSYENAANLSAKYIEHIQRKEGTTLGRVEIHAELLDNLGLYWNPDSFVYRPIALDQLDRIVVAVDPSTSSDERSNETGIIVAGRSMHPDTKQPVGHVLADLSTMRGVEQNLRTIVQAYHDWNADAIVVETNNGGDFIPFSIRSVDHTVRVKTVTATRGKAVRAEPIAGLYEQGRILHSKPFQTLESQMIQYNPERPRDRHNSPDRMDALVWAFTELFSTQFVERRAITDPSLAFY